MANEEKRIWGIHTMDDGQFLKGGMVAIGWHEMGDLGRIGASRDAFKDEYAKAFPDATKRASQLTWGCCTASATRCKSGITSYFPQRATGW